VNIHPTAVIHPQAQIHPSVQVGAYAVIEGPAIIGEDCVISPHAILSSEVVLGPRNVIGHGALIGGDPQDLAFRRDVKSRVVIGEGNRIREYATIHRGTAEGSETVVGNHCYLMAGAHLAHNVRLGDHVILANNVLVAGYVTIEDRVFVGGGSVFHQHIRVGAYAICQGLSGFGKDIPPYVIAARINGVAGLNVVGLRRNGFNAEQRAEIKRAFDLLYRRGLNTKQAIEAAALENWTGIGERFWTFVGAAKKKGLCDWLGSRGGNHGDE
jgi:UDP-N-acetylglucosamine acyltransferase